MIVFWICVGKEYILLPCSGVNKYSYSEWALYISEAVGVPNSATQIKALATVDLLITFIFVCKTYKRITSCLSKLNLVLIGGSKYLVYTASFPTVSIFLLFLYRAGRKVSFRKEGFQQERLCTTESPWLLNLSKF